MVVIVILDLHVVVLVSLLLLPPAPIPLLLLWTYLLGTKRMQRKYISERRAWYHWYATRVA